ncbi:hypothetical protein [Nitrobacter sp. JJSN]|uniref:hypothetical protein n=1 Tax=Nitrobacter sp. JJSN TaxID=3453033 RepID=UPI003F777A1E
MVIPTIYEQLGSRFKSEWLNKPALLPHYEYMDAIKAAVTATSNHRTQLSDSGVHSPKGIAEQIRVKAAKDLVPVLKRASDHSDRTKAATDQRRKNLTTPKVDPTDPVAEMQRAEMRANLKPLSTGDRIAAAAKDPRVADAYLSAPAFLSGSNETERAQIDDLVAKQFHGDALQEIETERDALAVLDAVIDVGLTDLRKATDFENSPKQFDDWMHSLTPPKPTISESQPGVLRPSDIGPRTAAVASNSGI